MAIEAIDMDESPWPKMGGLETIPSKMGWFMIDLTPSIFHFFLWRSLKPWMSQIPIGCLINRGVQTDPCNNRYITDDADGIPNRPLYFSQKDIIDTPYSWTGIELDRTIELQ